LPVAPAADSTARSAPPWPPWRRPLQSVAGARWAPWALLALLYTILTLVSFWPLPRLWQDHLGPDHGDPLFNLYVLKWGAHQIRLGLPDLWNANLFFPARGTLTYSDHLLGPAAQLALFETVVPNAIAGYNFLFLSSFAASALATCWVLRRSGLSWIASGLAGWMYACSPFRLSQTPHLQILLAQWIPLTLWFWDRLLAERTAKKAALFLLFYLLNLTGGCYLAYMIHFPLLAILLCRGWAERRALVTSRSLRLVLPVALLAGVAVALIFVPYARVSRELGLSRQASDVAVYGATWASYWSPAGESLYLGEGRREAVRSWLARHAPRSAPLFFRPENSLFAGFLPTLLALAGVAGAWASRRERQPDLWMRGLALSGFLCFALSFTVVYERVMELVPGLSGMRVPPRFYAFVSLTLVYFAGRGVDLLLARLRRAGSPSVPSTVAPARCATVLAPVFALVLALALVLELAPARLAWEPLPREEELPQVYAWIRDEPSVHALLELPIFEGPDENVYLYASTVHWKPIVNGFSGYIPPLHDLLTARIHFLPDADELALLRQKGVSHLVVHARAAKRRVRLRAWEAELATGPHRLVERVYGDERHFVYRVLADPAAAGPRG
jgi:hypothetical protein